MRVSKGSFGLFNKFACTGFSLIFNVGNTNWNLPFTYGVVFVHINIVTININTCTYKASQIKLTPEIAKSFLN